MHIFTIKIFLKNTLLCLDSQNKERRRQETHYYASEVRILAVLARFKADFDLFWPFPACFGRIGRFGRRPIQPNMADTAQFWSNQPDSARIEPHQQELSRVCVNLRKKKKSLDAALTCEQLRRTPRLASCRVKLECGTLPAASVLSR